MSGLLFLPHFYITIPPLEYAEHVLYIIKVVGGGGSPPGPFPLKLIEAHCSDTWDFIFLFGAMHEQ